LVKLLGSRIWGFTSAALVYILRAINGLPVLLLTGGAFGDLSGALLVFILIFSVLKIEFSVVWKPKKRRKK
jgi:hypothetical protein